MLIKELVSVVIPMFNSEDFIKETLSSVLNQTYKKLEVIIVDDGSVDDSVQVVKKVIQSKKEHRIKILLLKLNSGIPALPRNYGIKVAKGEYIAFLDSDDIWHPKKIELQLNYMRKYNSYMCSSTIIDFERFFSFNRIKKPLNNIEYISLFNQMIKYRTPTSSLIIKTEVIKQNLFKENISLRGKEDLYNSLILHSRYGKSIKVLDELVFYRKRKNQVSSSKFEMIIKTIYIFIIIDLKQNNIYRLFLPLFIITNLLFFIYYRIILKKL
jgi:glycosyltransferase involved in cell wall biosynthesis